LPSITGLPADIAQAQHGRAVGHHADQVAAGGVAEGSGGVLDDFFTGRGHAGGIGQCQVMLIDHLLGRSNRDLAGLGKLVIFECGPTQQGALVGRVVGRVVGHQASPIVSEGMADVAACEHCAPSAVCKGSRL